MKTKTEEEIHYRSLIKFLIWAIGIIGVLLTILFSVGIYFTYHSFDDARNDLKESLKDAKDRLKEVDDRAKLTLDDTKENANRTVNYIKNEALTAAVNASKEKVEQTFKENS